MNVIPAFLVGTAVLLPATVRGANRLSRNAGSDARRDVIRWWLYFLTFVLLIRFAAGLMIFGGAHLPEASYFYPIRIAFPNWKVLPGLPYLALCLAALFYLPRIAAFIGGSRWRYVLLWGFGAALLIAFGAIHGGLIAGNIGVADGPDHLYDAQLNATPWDTLATHVDRIAGRIAPAYHAPHSTSHPAFAVVYWQLLALSIPPFVFSLINVSIFALVFPLILWALRRRFAPDLALQATFACLLIPGLLIYGRSDDAVYYAVAGAAMALISVALNEKRPVPAAGAGVLAAIGMNLSYAAIVLVPAMFSFTAETPLRHLWQYIRRIAPYFLIVAAIIVAVAFVIAWTTGFDLWTGFRASVAFNRPTNILSVLARGEHARALSDRLMAWGDFPLFAGPLLLYLCVSLVRGWTPRISAWHINNIALAVLLLMLAVNSSGAGEIARPWGSIYLLVGICWLPGFFQTHNEQLRWWLVRVQFGWALMLQAILNFAW